MPVDAIISKLVGMAASKAGQQVADKLNNTFLKSNVSPAQLESWAESIDLIELGVNIAHDASRDDAYAGGSTFGYLREVADKTAPDGGFIAGLGVGIYSAFRGKSGKKMYLQKLASWKKNGFFKVGDPAVTYSVAPAGSKAAKVLSGDLSVWESYQASKMNAQYVKPQAFGPVKMAQIAKAVITGKRIGIEAGIVLLANEQVVQLSSLVNKPTVAVEKAKDVNIMPGSSDASMWSKVLIPTREPEEDTPPPPPPPVDDDDDDANSQLAIIGIGAAALYFAAKKG